MRTPFDRVKRARVVRMSASTSYGAKFDGAFPFDRQGRFFPQKKSSTGKKNAGRL
jgi:hypothetical protein